MNLEVGFRSVIIRPFPVPLELKYLLLPGSRQFVNHFAISRPLRNMVYIGACK